MLLLLPLDEDASRETEGEMECSSTKRKRVGKKERKRERERERERETKKKGLASCGDDRVTTRIAVGFAENKDEQAQVEEAATKAAQVQAIEAVTCSGRSGGNGRSMSPIAQ